MDRRAYLKASVAFGSSLLMPAGVLALVGCSRTPLTPELAGFNGSTMGTGFSVRLGVSKLPEIDQLAAQVSEVLKDVDIHMSTWRADSELSLLNASRHSDWQAMTPATTQVIAQALDTSARSDGAFDVTVGPLVDLWGFGAGADDSTAGSKPTGQAISRRMAQVGHGSIEVNIAENTVRKLNAGTRLDLSGIAKGHAVDRVAALLDSAGHHSYLIEVGGELKARGRKPDGSAWRVAIERPSVGKRQAFRAVDLNNQAIATSGDYRNFFSNGGQRYSHSIDPRTGAPVNHQLASVSVVAESTMAADALSTALMVLGPDGAMAFANKHQIAAHLILKSGTSLKEEYSRAFEPLVS